MPDPRISKLASVLVDYSLEIKPGQQFLITADPLARDLTLSVYEEAIKAGAHVTIMQPLPGADEIFFKHASEQQLEYVSPIRKLMIETFDATLSLGAPENRRTLAGVDPKRMSRNQKANQGIMKTYMERAAKTELRWCVTVVPNNAHAQDADMSLADYTEFVFSAGMLNEPDPVAYWKQEGQHQRRLADWLAGRDQVSLKGSNIDLSLSIKGRAFVTADGKYNFPDGEIFTGPVEDSVNGWVRFRYPAIYAGQEVTDIELWFENGRVVREQASKNQELLTAMLNTDPGARHLGEWGIGTNYGIQKFTKNMLFDEKIGGTIHLAVGAAYPETGGQNQSGVHWDMLCDMAESEIHVDGDLFYQNGKPVI